MKIYSATIVERSGACLHPVFIGDDSTTEIDMIKFWGLDEPDVVEYKITCKQV